MISDNQSNTKSAATCKSHGHDRVLTSHERVMTSHERDMSWHDVIMTKREHDINMTWTAREKTRNNCNQKLSTTKITSKKHLCEMHHRNWHSKWHNRKRCSMQIQKRATTILKQIWQRTTLRGTCSAHVRHMPPEPWKQISLIIMQTMHKQSKLHLLQNSFLRQLSLKIFTSSPSASPRQKPQHPESMSWVWAHQTRA